MKKIRSLFLITLGFMLGIVFIVRCGGDMKTLAEQGAEFLASAISFDNSGTSLDSQTTQDAISEIADTISFVKDSTGQKVGLFLNYDEKNQFWIILDSKTKTPVAVDSVTGSIIGYSNSNLVYLSSDCSGTPYYPLGHDSILIYNNVDSHDSSTWDDYRYIEQATLPIYISGKIYWYSLAESKVELKDIRSDLSWDGVCTAWPETGAIGSDYSKATSAPSIVASKEFYLSPIFAEAVEVSVQPYTGPLTIY